MQAVEAPRAVARQRAGLEVARVERLEGMLHDDRLPGSARRPAHRVVDDVEQLADGDGRRTRQVRALVTSRVGDHQVVLRRQQGVEEELAVLAAHVAVADPGRTRGQVVPVPLDVPREAAVVEPEQAHHPVRDRTHRDEGADGEVPGPEVRPRRLALEPVRHDRADVVTAQLHAAGVLAGRRLGHELLQQGGELRALPVVARRGRAQRVGRPGQGVGPVAHRPHPRQLVEHPLQAVHELGQAAGQLDVTAVDVVERQRLAEEALPVLRHRHPEQDPVQPGVPGVGVDVGQLEGAAVRSVESPPHERAVDPLLEPEEVVVAEAEAPPDGVPARQIEDLARRDPRRGELHHLRQHAHHRVGLAQRAVGEPDLQLAGGVEWPVVEVVRAERRLNQRREVLDVRAHDDDVARLERRVVRQQVQHRIAQHLDLAPPAVARVHADAVVVRREHRPPIFVAPRPGGRPVETDVVLDPAQQRRHRLVRPAQQPPGRAGPRLPAPAASRARRDPTTRAADGSARSRSGPQPAPRSATTRRPPACSLAHNAGRGVQEEEMHLASLGDRVEDVEVTGREAREPEQRQPRRQVEELGLLAQQLARVDQALGRPRLADPLPQEPPQIDLPRRLAELG